MAGVATKSLLAVVPRPVKPSRGDLQLVVKMLAAGTLAWWLATLLGSPRPLFAVLVPLVAMDGDSFSALNVSIARTFGVFAGVLLGLGLLQLDLPSTVLVALLLSLSLAAGLALRFRGGPVNNQVAITAMFMLYVGAATKAETVGEARIWETALGAAVAFAVSALVWPPHPVAEARRRVDRLRGWLREDMSRVAGQLAAPDGAQAEEMLELIRERSLQAVKDVLDLERGERALRWNPRNRTDAAAFAVERARVSGAARQYRHLRTLARTVADVAANEQPLPAAERDRLVRTMATLTEAETDSQIRPPAIDPASLHDPRAIGLAVKLAQMSDDLAA
jgi:uncharacterized membrane protein YgaE (UPF0421/DUF939 family)